MKVSLESRAAEAGKEEAATAAAKRSEDETILREELAQMKKSLEKNSG